MSGIIPLPNTRVSGTLIRQRLMAQLQSDQLDLFRLQNQLSTGQRITLPSEDAPAARRAMTLQRLLERKDQFRANVDTGQTFLKSTDVALNNVATLLGDIRGTALGASGTTSTEAIRKAAIADVNRAVEQLLATANTNFRGRYLFTGSQTNVEPYAYEGDYVKYFGDGTQLTSFSDVGVLFGTNAAGIDVFGGISSRVLGGKPLTPQLTDDTLLSTLRGGRGISPGASLAISDGTNTRIVDISRAATVGDVIRMIEANPPAGRELTATISDGGITLQLDAAGGGNLTVSEVGSGKAASELGLLNTSGVGITPLAGSPLEPIITKTTRLEDLLGTKARARLQSPGDNNDLLITANQNGSGLLSLDGVTIQIVDDELIEAAPGVSPGGEYAVYYDSAQPARASLRFTGVGNDLQLTAATSGTAFNDVDIVLQGATGMGDDAAVAYDAGMKRLTITVDDAGATTIGTLQARINAEGTFTAAQDLSSDPSFNPAATIAAADINVVRGDTGNSGGAGKTLYVHVAAGLSTANQVRDAINAEGRFTAELDTLDTTNTTQAGAEPVSIDATAVTSGGSGDNLDLDGLRIVNGEGPPEVISFAGAETVEDLLNILNGSPANVMAEINADGTSINIRSRLAGADFQIGENGGFTATKLGLRSFTEETRLDELNYGVGVPTKAGVDLQLNSSTLEITTRSGATVNVNLSTALTVTDVINQINAAAGPSLTAQPGPGGIGISLSDNTIGTDDLSIDQSGPPLAIAGGVATHVRPIDFTINTRDGAAYNITLSGAETIEDVLTMIESQTSGAVEARLAINGNGVELEDATGGAGNFWITPAFGSQAAEKLGLVPEGAAPTPVDVITGSDRNYLETESVFTTLVRLKDALEANDIVAMERAIALIDEDLDRVTFARSEVGARQQALDITQQNLEEEDVQLRTALSEEIEVDIVEAISNLTARQISLEASLRATANILQLSLLNFI
jgi:flagellin-like hook-associated protein FlgL